MKNKITLLFSLLIMSLVLVSACNKDATISETLLSEDEKKAEKNKIQEVLKLYNKAANEKNWSKMVATLASDVHFFGTDSGEVSANMDAFKTKMQTQWNEYDSIVYGEIHDLYIELDDYARYANAIFGCPFTIVKKGAVPENLYVVCQRTLQKDPSTQSWTIKSGILAVSRVER
ncbi:MAG: nuclear transport factor 2 family protein [Ignavibacteria bacterium]|jgi:hypothetical protein|nr:nuclear transport factor 2 family protein [Ignavibacteria bacterium]